MMEQNERFLLEPPIPENAFTIQGGNWTSRVPGLTNTMTGNLDLFSDDRMKWVLDNLKIQTGIKVLELGPLEGAHSSQLEAAGLSVVAIEANVNAFLRCLIVKNHFDMKTKFLLGDFGAVDYIFPKVDLIVASGVLYHQQNPLALLEKISRSSDQLFLWTHIWDDRYELWDSEIVKLVGKKFIPKSTQTLIFNGLKIRLIPYLYENTLDWDGFTGGVAGGSKWIHREDLVPLLKSFGYDDVKLNFDQADHPHGPAIGIWASRS
ncbi:AdoMet_MTases domain containing protein [Candidatus Nanopelagicaceae bacterium]